MSNVSIKNCDFSYFNTTTYGTLYLEVVSLLEVFNSSFSNSLGVGNAIYARGFNYIVVKFCNFVNIKGNQGGAMYLNFGDYSYIYNSFFVNNTAFVEGGAI